MIILIPPRSSCNNFALLSVHTMVFFLRLNMAFMAHVWKGVTMRRNPIPARDEAPRLTSKMMMTIINWMGAVQTMWKNPAQLEDTARVTASVKCSERRQQKGR